MQIALIVEGCYPYLTGGVSTWCDQLIRGLDDHDFEVVAITATSRMRPAMAIPFNVTAVRPVPLWDWNVRRRRTSQATREDFLRIYRGLLAAMLDVSAVQRGFDLALKELFEFAQQVDLSAVFSSDDVIDALMDVWPRVYPSVPMRVRDAVEATELLEHMLLPLSARIPRADVCHPVSNGLPALLALAAKWRYGTPMVMSEHGVYLRERYLAFQTVEYRWPVKAVMLAFMRRLCRTAYEEADVIAPVNVFNRRWEIRHGADPDRIHTVYNGVASDLLPVAAQEPTVPTIGWVGRVDPLKDLETLVRAFALVREQVPDAVLRLFGPVQAGNEEYAVFVRSVIAELGLNEVVTFEGPTRPITSAYHASTVVALSSISEGLPYTVMEAMMCGRATVSTDVGGVAEVAGTAGLIVPPRDPRAFADALIQLLSDDVTRQRMAARARDRALEMFQLESMLATFRGLYADLHRGRAPEPAQVAEIVPAGIGVHAGAGAGAGIGPDVAGLQALLVGAALADDTPPIGHSLVVDGAHAGGSIPRPVRHLRR
ncbi:MAG TPA: GT4 family glycosyltransferase PelF, partial [Kineosporiaceae bacterium]|nr:GT4 family glycosyltransferase PelF [Kineosporiaceae bacterium]